VTEITLPGCDIEVYQSRDEWLAARGIGASSSPSILGVSYAENSAMTEWGRITGAIPPMKDSQGLRIGRKLEPLILELFEEETEHIISSLGSFAVCRSKQYPWLTASLDGLVIDLDEGQGVAEAKNVGQFMAAEWNDDDQPLKFKVQTQHQIAVSGLDFAYTIGLIGGNKLKYVKSYRDQKFIDTMLPRLAEFHELVITNTEPTGKWIDGTEATKKALGKIHPRDNGEVIILPQESYLWHTKLEELKAGIKLAEVEKTKLENLLRSEIGDATTGTLPDGTVYNWKWQSRQEHIVKASEFRVLRHSKK
jgi:putative phage-type endonuclease